jgi:hypothetical protein
MSLMHVRLNRIFDDNDNVLYKVESTDFTNENIWLELGLLRISKAVKKYQFIES